MCLPCKARDIWENGKRYVRNGDKIVFQGRLTPCWRRKKGERFGIYMKIIFWLLAVLSIFAGLFMSVISYMSYGLGFSYTIIGDIVLIAGMFSLVVCIVCVVLGILRLRKGNVKKAIVCILVALCYCVVILAGIAIDDALYSLLLDKRAVYDNEQISFQRQCTL